jgi:hypothetical protein
MLVGAERQRAAVARIPGKPGRRGCAPLPFPPPRPTGDAADRYQRDGSQTDSFQSGGAHDNGRAIALPRRPAEKAPQTAGRVSRAADLLGSITERMQFLHTERSGARMQR